MIFRASIFFLLSLASLTRSNAKDYFLTIAGGFSPQGNQASLEANVVFYQGLIADNTSQSPEHKIYFADGFDDKHDLQTVAPRPAPKSAAFALLQSVFDLDRDRIVYRNHRVEDISGPISPTEIRDGFDSLQRQLQSGDRLIIYVTAHGSAAKGKDKMNTSIACWNRKELTMKSFAGWLDELPNSVPVVLVMAQCYCGGFVNTMFQKGDSTQPLSEKLRVGFFAQRHDLPAAGCRPDIENDEEYSSYFWGAFRGMLRSGKAIEDADFNRDGKISFAEAHAFAVMDSPTIDIPLKSSDEFLRRYSRIPNRDTPVLGASDDLPSTTNADDGDELRELKGTIEELSAIASPESYKCIEGLANKLDISIQTPLAELLPLQKNLDAEARQARPQRGRGGSRGFRSSRRRDFREELIAKWPELKDPSEWDSIPWLQPEACDSFLKEVQELSNYEPFKKSLSERVESREKAAAAELKQVRMRRLVYTIESVLLEHNFHLLAEESLKERFTAMRSLEHATLP
jgi:hypothetical protein